MDVAEEQTSLSVGKGKCKAMMAFYYNNDSGPFHMYCLKVKDAEYHSFFQAIENESYPFPSGDVIIMDGEDLIDQFFPGGEQNERVFK